MINTNTIYIRPENNEVIEAIIRECVAEYNELPTLLRFGFNKIKYYPMIDNIIREYLANAKSSDIFYTYIQKCDLQNPDDYKIAYEYLQFNADIYISSLLIRSLCNFHNIP